MDAMSMPESDGFDQIWVVVDRLTHFLCLIPACSTDTSARVARRLFDSVFCVFGLPSLITSDNDSRLTSEFFTSLMSMAGINRFVTPPERKQGNGLAERFIRSLRAYIRTISVPDWLQNVSAAAFSFNTIYSAAVGVTPAQLLLGYQPRGPLEVVLPAQESSSDPFDFLRRRAVLQEAARSQLFEQQLTRVQTAGLRRLPPGEWEEGDLAFVSAERLTNPSEDHLPAKLRSAFTGPFPVARVEPPNLVLRLPAPHRERDFVVNLDDVFKFSGSAESLPSDGGVIVEPDENDETKDDPRPLYVATRLLCHRRFKKVLKYKVDWVAAAPTFEPEHELSDDLLQEYWRNVARRPRAVIPEEARRWLDNSVPVG